MPFVQGPVSAQRNYMKLNFGTDYLLVTGGAGEYRICLEAPTTVTRQGVLYDVPTKVIAAIPPRGACGARSETFLGAPKTKLIPGSGEQRHRVMETPLSRTKSSDPPFRNSEFFVSWIEIRTSAANDAGLEHMDCALTERYRRFR